MALVTKEGNLVCSQDNSYYVIIGHIYWPAPTYRTFSFHPGCFYAVDN